MHLMVTQHAYLWINYIFQKNSTKVCQKEVYFVCVSSDSGEPE